jgi:hypothetical protein
MLMLTKLPNIHGGVQAECLMQPPKGKGGGKKHVASAMG